MPDETELTESQVNEEIPDDLPVENKNNRALFWIILGVIIFLGLIITGIILLANPATDTNKIRDIFIIFMALESFIIGIALIVLVVQVSLLINLVNNEIRPILKNTVDTVNNLKGTTKFLSEELVSPVIKMNEYMAGFKRLLDLLRPFGK
jgi:hypothetical protein